MKRILLSLVVIATMVATLAFAASLTVEGGTVQAGSDDSLTCDDSVVVSYTVAWQNNQFKVTSVTVGDIATECAGLDLLVELTDANGAGISSGSVAAATSPETVVDVADVAAENVYDVHVAIYATAPQQ